jgi:hypothetical protein
MANDNPEDPFAGLPAPRQPSAALMESLNSDDAPDLSLPLSQPEVIPDSQISAFNRPFMKHATTEFERGHDDLTRIDPASSLGSVTLSGFSHIDANERSAGVRAQTICRDLVSRDYLTEKFNLDKEQMNWGRGAGLDGSFFPIMANDLKNKGPFHVEISTDNRRLIFLIKSNDPAISETGRVEIRVGSLARFGKTYLQIAEANESCGRSLPTRHAFEDARDEAHLNCSAFLGEKFAQQGWYIGLGLAKLMFELTLYLAAPSMMARANAEIGIGSTGGDGRQRLAGPTL